MRPELLAIAALVASTAIPATLFVQSLSSISTQTQTSSRYPPLYATSGDLILPKNFHKWAYLGSGGSWTLPIPKQQAPTL
jgi:hypothetical protein